MIGASALCLPRKACDHWVAHRAYDKLFKALDSTKQFNVPIGIGASVYSLKRAYLNR